MNIFRTHLLAVFVGVAVFCCAVSVARAAQIAVESPAAPVGVGDAFTVRILLNTQGASINALGGTIHYPTGILSLREIRDGNSLVNFWVEKPAATLGAIHFSGITPGGFSGEGGELFTLVFEVKAAGRAQLSFADFHALLNDGKGTETRLTFSAFPISVNTKGSGKEVAPLSESDREAPEPFTATVQSDPSLFDGKYFLVFATQDKGSGVDHFEVAEKLGFKTSSFADLSWHIATSPYLLSDQAQRSYIYVKAVDRAGNQRIEVLSPKNLPFYYDPRILLAILVVILLVASRRFYAFLPQSKRFS